ncbi:hypothetical protein Tco_0839286 [Tanacetum coccineum]|uniref:CCHC-type domain-containing protein n=1 Tax=Tanacetum coccineum TaxID=301880 RepID=A0ABQ5AV86_9ASTR
MGLEDKILVPKPPQNCATCGDPVDGLYCRPCAFVRKCLNEGWYTIHDENEILNTSESSNHNTNVVSAPQEPFVFNQDPGQNSSRSPPHIDHNCCYECGDSLNDIFCQRCTCKSCGKGAHYGYNCPPQIPIISNPEPCYNQNLNEILQNLQSLQQQCLLGKRGFQPERLAWVWLCNDYLSGRGISFLDLGRTSLKEGRYSDNMVQTRNSDNNNPTDPIATQLAAIAAKLEAIETMKEFIAALKEGDRSRSRGSNNSDGESGVDSRLDSITRLISRILVAETLAVGC